MVIMNCISGDHIWNGNVACAGGFGSGAGDAAFFGGGVSSSSSKRPMGSPIATLGGCATARAHSNEAEGRPTFH